MTFAVPNRLRRTFLAVLTGRGLVALRQLFLVPVLIYAWGAEYYGGWLVVTAIPSFLSMSNLGLGTAAYNKIVRDIAANDNDAARQTLVAGILSIGLAGTLTLVVVATCIGFVDFNWAKRGGLENSGVILLLLLPALFLQMAASPFLGMWTGSGEPSVGYRQQNILSIGAFAVTTAVPLLGGRAEALAAATLIWTIIWFVLIVIKANSTFCLEWKAHMCARVERHLVWMLLRIGVGHQLSQLWQAIYFQGSLLVAGATLGPTGAALWGSLRIVSRSGNQSLELISQSLGPEFQLAHSKGDNERLKKLHSIGLFASLILSTCIGAGLVLMGGYAFAIWTNGQLEVANGIWWPLSLSLLAFSLWWISSEVQRSINQPWAINTWAVIAACMSIAYMAQMSSTQGVFAFAIGSLLFDGLMVLFVLPCTLKIVGQSRSELGKDLRGIVRRPVSSFVSSITGSP